MTTLRCLSVSLLAAIVVSVGCSRLPELAPVSGRVTLDGKPLEFGGVMFQPERGPASTAAIGNDGRFTLTWQRKSAGAVIGLNRVAVTAYESDRPGYQPPPLSPGEEPRIGKSVVPERYTSISESGLEIDVQLGMDDVELRLTSTP
jgi:hypothetical protein